MLKDTTYFNPRPCPEGKIAFTTGLGEQETLYLCLVEDRTYSREEVLRALVDALREKEVEEEHVRKEAERLYEAIRTFLDECKHAVTKVFGALYSVKAPLDISLPKADGDRLRPGEFPGNYLISERPRLILHVEPKIGWDNYRKMVDEARVAITTIVAETGVLEPFLGNLYYPFSSTPVSYSILLIKLTEYILSSTPPKRITRARLVSEGEVGKLHIPGVLKYAFQGLPLGVFERARVESHMLPFMLLAKLHYLLVALLDSVKDYLLGLQTPSTILELVISTAKILRDVHLIYLTTHPLSDALQALQHTSISDAELVGEVRRAARVNPYFEVLADLYEMFRSNIGLVHAYIGKGLLLPVASSKIYELWVLSKLVNRVRESFSIQKLEVRKHKDLFAELEVGPLRITYNEPLEGVFVKHLAESYLRPDFVLERDGKIVVYDAKYKRKLTTEDVVRLLAYIAEYAKPVDIDGAKYMIGGFYKLKGKHRDIYIRDRDMPVKVQIHIYTLDPSLNDKVINENVEKSINYLLKPS